MKADRIIDWSAAHRITDASGALVGTLRRKGGRSLWRATYVITDPNEQAIGGIHEKDPWTKVLDGLLSMVPILGEFTGYFINPSYVVSGATTRCSRSASARPSSRGGSRSSRSARSTHAPNRCSSRAC
jgi:hypothetical protein